MQLMPLNIIGSPLLDYISINRLTVLLPAYLSSCIYRHGDQTAHQRRFLENDSVQIAPLCPAGWVGMRAMRPYSAL